MILSFEGFFHPPWKPWQHKSQCECAHIPLTSTPCSLSPRSSFFKSREAVGPAVFTESHGRAPELGPSPATDEVEKNSHKGRKENNCSLYTLTRLQAQVCPTLRLPLNTRDAEASEPDPGDHHGAENSVPLKEVPSHKHLFSQ